MIQKFAKRNLQPGMIAVEIYGSVHNGPDCARLQREVDAMIAAGETRVIFDLSGLTHADSAAIGASARLTTIIVIRNSATAIADPT